MREIKFRIWDENKKQMFYPDDFDNKIKLPGEDVNKKYSIYMQYIGLKDKNGKEIYEGDIIESNGEVIGVIKFDDYYKRFILEDNESVTGVCQDYINDYDWIVIGNIYENSELLEG